MTDAAQSSRRERRFEFSSLQNTDKIHSSAPIVEKLDNETQRRMQARDSLATFRLTHDRANSFTIDTEKGEVKDGRLFASFDYEPVRGFNASYSDGIKACAPDATIEHLTANLNKWADRCIALPPACDIEGAPALVDAKTFQSFKHDLQEFQQTARQRGLLATDVQKTLFQVERLLHPDDQSAPQGAQTLSLIATEIMMHAAHPTSIDQGHFNTCNVATIESRTFTRNPGEAARLIADIALNGQYETTQKFDMPEGKMAPLLVSGLFWKDREASEKPHDGARTFASEIFQNAAVNIYYSLQNRLYGAHLEYTEDFLLPRKRHDTGERIMDTTTFQYQPDVKSPLLVDNALPVIADAISGTDHGQDIMVVHDSYHSGPTNNLTAISTLAELKNTFHRLKEEHKFPIILKVNCVCEPFYSDGRFDRRDGSSACHVVTVRDFDSNKGIAIVYNQWGIDSDHGSKNPIEIKALFVAMHDTPDAVTALQNQINNDRAHGIFDPRKHMQLMRLENLVGNLADDDYEKNFRKELQVVTSHWGRISTREQQAESQALVAMTHNLRTNNREKLVAKAFQDKLISRPVFASESRAARRAVREEAEDAQEALEAKKSQDKEDARAKF